MVNQLVNDRLGNWSTGGSGQTIPGLSVAVTPLR